MQKRTKRLIKKITESISNSYPYLSKKEQSEIFENFLYESILNEIGLNDPKRLQAALKDPLNPNNFQLKDYSGLIRSAGQAAKNDVIHGVGGGSFFGHTQTSNGANDYLRDRIGERYDKFLAIFSKKYGLPVDDPRIIQLAFVNSGMANMANLWTNRRKDGLKNEKGEDIYQGGNMGRFPYQSSNKFGKYSFK